MRYNFTSPEWLKLKRLTIASAGEEAEPLDSYTACGNMQPFWKIIGPFLIKLNIYPPSEPSFALWLYIKKYGWLMCTKKTEI